MPTPSFTSRRTIALVAVVLTGLAVVWVRGNATNIKQAQRLTEALEVGAGAARLVHEVQRERDMSAYFVATGRRLEYGSMVAQRVWVNQGMRAYEEQVRRLEPRLGEYDPGLRASLAEADRRLDGLRTFRVERLDPKDEQVGTAETLRAYGTTVDALLGVVVEVSKVGEGSALSQDLQAAVALGRYKEAVGQERSYLYATYAAGGFAAGKADPPTPAGVARAEIAESQDTRGLPFRGFTSILGTKASWRSRFDAVASGEWDARLAKALDPGGDAARADQFAAAVVEDPGEIRRVDQSALRGWFFAMNSYMDTLRRLENQLVSDLTARASAAREGSDLW
jgi:hypothetical protein